MQHQQHAGAKVSDWPKALWSTTGLCRQAAEGEEKYTALYYDVISRRWASVQDPWCMDYLIALPDGVQGILADFTGFRETCQPVEMTLQVQRSSARHMNQPLN
jgi:hypothetical protein